MKHRLFLPSLGFAWLMTTLCGLSFMMSYEGTPGVAAASSVEWASKSRIQLANDRPTLVMLAHPQCPCTRASIGELNALLAQCSNKVQVDVLFLKPKGAPKDWEKTDLWRSAAAIPGVRAIADEGGTEARRFHVATSGQALLFDQNGHLLFSGGITAGRGHSGDNAGRDAIVSLVNTGKAKLHKTSVFGCSLLASSLVGGSH
jgi:hypothetical protein